MAWSTVKIALKFYAVIWITAVGGFVGSRLFGVVGQGGGGWLGFEISGDFVQNCANTGWYVGTVLFLVGAISGHIRFINGGSPLKSQDSSDDQSSSSMPTQTSELADDSKRAGVFSTAIGLGFVGGMLGAMFGASLLVFWFSFASSPFAMDGTTTAFEVVQQKESVSKATHTAYATSHPVALYLVLIPAMLGTFLGVVGGGVGAATGVVRDP